MAKVKLHWMGFMVVMYDPEAENGLVYLGDSTKDWRNPAEWRNSLYVAPTAIHHHWSTVFECMETLFCRMTGRSDSS